MCIEASTPAGLIVQVKPTNEHAIGQEGLHVKPTFPDAAAQKSTSDGWDGNETRGRNGKERAQKSLIYILRSKDGLIWKTLILLE